MLPRTRRLIAIVAAVLLVTLAGLLAFVWWGPVPIADKRVMLDFLLGRGIAPPTAAVVEARLRAPPGFRVQVYSADVPLARVLLATGSGDLVVSRTRANVVTLLERDRRCSRSQRSAPPPPADVAGALPGAAAAAAVRFGARRGAAVVAARRSLSQSTRNSSSTRRK